MSPRESERIIRQPYLIAMRAAVIYFMRYRNDHVGVGVGVSAGTKANLEVRALDIMV